MKLSPAHKRLLALAERQQDAHLQAARSAVVAQHARLSLTDAQKALEAALSLPRARRGPALRDTLALIDRATSGLRVPPADLGPVLRRAVRDRMLSTDDLAELSNPALKFNDSRELQVAAVKRQREVMNGYFAKEGQRFRSDVAQTLREVARRGLDPEKAADLLEARLGVTRSRAVLIATDQLRTLISRAEITRLKQLGVKEFQWWSARVPTSRKEHVLLHGRVFTWRGAPELPGEAVNCLCRALIPSKS